MEVKIYINNTNLKSIRLIKIYIIKKLPTNFALDALLQPLKFWNLSLTESTYIWILKKYLIGSKSIDPDPSAKAGSVILVATSISYLWKSSMPSSASSLIPISSMSFSFLP